MKEDTVISQKINVPVFNWQLDHNEETHSESVVLMLSSFTTLAAKGFLIHPLAVLVHF